MTNKTRTSLFDALDSCRAIRRYTDGVDFAAYLRDNMMRDAIERRLGIIGEAPHHAEALDPSLADQLPELRRIVGLRNRVIHAYFDVNPAIVWDIVVNRLPSLQERLAKLLTEDPAHDDPSNPPPCT
jgi:uncharacterized protein with HEPN domain